MKPDKYKQDYYHQQAKIDGYRARAAYKIIQIDRRFNLFSHSKNILDLGCAPGSWIQAILKSSSTKNFRIMGVDMTRVAPIEGVKILKMDVFSPKLEKEIEEYFVKGLDIVISDMAPNTSGNKTLDANRSIDLVRRAYSLSEKYLKKNGDFVAKVFQNQELNSFVKQIKPKFRSVVIHKPKASRKGNREIYIVAKKKLY